MTSTSLLTSHQSLTIWTRLKPHIQSQKDNWKDQERGWLPLWVSRPKYGSQKCKKAIYAIGNISEKDLLKIIKEFEKIEKLPYEKKRPKHEPTDSYFCLARQLAKCMMRSDKINWHDHGSYTEMTAPSSNVNVTDEDE